MSLILEALKKLERERQSPDRGFLVLGSGTWSAAAPSRRRMAAALLGAVLLGAAGGTAFWRLRDATPSRAAAEAVPSPALPIAAPPATPLLAATLPAAPPPQPASVRPAQPPAAAAAPTDVREASEDSAVRVPDSTAAASGGSSAPPDPEPRLKLQAISRRDGRLVAVLGDRLVYEGDSFDGVRVLRIGEAEVELEVEGRRVVIGF